MNRRLHRAILEASELRALFVLIILLALRAWRGTQFAYYSLPSLMEIVQYIQRRVNVKITYHLYPVHWIGSR